MNRRILLGLAFLLVNACSKGYAETPKTQVPPTRTSVPTATSTQTPIPTATLTPTITPTPEPTITAPPPRDNPIFLPGGLEIEEYPISIGDDYWQFELSVKARHPNQVIADYVRPSYKGRFILESNYFHLKVSDKEIFTSIPKRLHVILTIIANDGTITEIDCGSGYPIGPVVTAWTYREDWIFQTVNDGTFDVLWNGEFLNSSKGYQESLGFQILGEKPFYFFQRDDRMWLSYDGVEVLLPYDIVETQYCCEGYPSPSPRHYSGMITFYAKENEQLYFVVIGHLTETD